MGSKSAGGGTQTTEPWSGQAPYLQTGFQEAQRLLNEGGPQYFPGQTYTNFSPQTETGLGMIERRALAGSPEASALSGYVTGALNGQASDYGAGQFAQSVLSQPGQSFNDLARQTAGTAMQPGSSTLATTARGSMLNANPYLDQTFSQAARGMQREFSEGVNPAIAATFSRAGRTGSGAHLAATGRAADSFAEGLGDLATNIYGGNYASERQHQLAAANSLNQTGLASAGQDIQRLGLAGSLLGQQNAMQLGAANIGSSLLGQQYQNQARAGALAPGAQELSYNDASRLLGVGQTVEGQGQRMIDDQFNRYMHEQERPYDSLGRYIAAIQGNYGGTTETQNTSSRAAGALGGAATAGGLASALGATGPVGWGIAGLGGLLGLFG